MEKFLNKDRCLHFLKKRHVHIAFSKSISDHKHFDKILEFISDGWEKRKIFFECSELQG